MAINIASTRRAALALAAGTTLVLGVAACSEAEDAANDASSAAGSAIDSVTAENSAEGSEGAEASEGADAEGSESADAEGAEGSEGAEASEGADAEGGEGSDGELPADIQTMWDNEGGESGALGALENVESGDNGTLATFANGWIAQSEETGAVKLIGKIGETWANGGGLDNEIGLPTAPEEGDAANGWTQSFQNGTITWAPGDNGEFTDTIEMN